MDIVNNLEHISDTLEMYGQSTGLCKGAQASKKKYAMPIFFLRPVWLD